MEVSHINAKELFDRMASDYEERCEEKVYNFSSLIFQRRMDIVKDMLRRDSQGGRVLDFGMGPAVFGSACTDQGLQYTGVDISPVMVEHARALNLPNAEFAVGDLDSLDSYHGQMDAVLAIGLLDYLEHPEAGVRALASCVLPGGHLILSFRNRLSLPRAERDVAKSIWRMFSRRNAVSDKAFHADVHEHSFDFSKQLQPLLQRLTFESFEVRYFNASPFFFNFPLPRWLWNKWRVLDSLLAGKSTRLLCSGGVLVARKMR